MNRWAVRAASVLLTAMAPVAATLTGSMSAGEPSPASSSMIPHVVSLAPLHVEPKPSPSVEQSPRPKIVRPKQQRKEGPARVAQSQTVYVPFTIRHDSQFSPLVERWRSLIIEVGLDQYQSVERWLQRIDCESDGIPSKINPAGPYIGLTQELNGSADPRTNLEQAKRKWESQGASAWPNC